MKILRNAAIACCALAGCVAVVPITISTETTSSRPTSVTMAYAPAGSISAQVGTLLNKERTDRGLDPLAHNPLIDQIATAHARDMYENQFFGHTGTNGRSSFQRLKRAGYGPCLSAENLAQGYTTPTDVVRGWMQSDGHRSNNLQPSALEYGVGYETEGHNWVLMLAAPGC